MEVVEAGQTAALSARYDVVLLQTQGCQGGRKDKLIAVSAYRPITSQHWVDLTQDGGVMRICNLGNKCGKQSTLGMTGCYRDDVSVHNDVDHAMGGEGEWVNNQNRVRSLQCHSHNCRPRK